MDSIVLKKRNGAFDLKIQLASSKSESNRALIINALCNFEGKLLNLSSARDTQTMIKLLDSKESSTADVLDAGTTMRFLTAYFTVSNISKKMTGTPRMCERPIGILVDALKTLGAEINYLEKEGYPPHQIQGLNEQKTAQLSIRGDVSSQYISALLMIAPYLPYGLILKLTGDIGSIPYIKMTIRQMEAFGVHVYEDWDNKTLKVAPQKYKPTEYKIESDWSGASYWYSIVALSEDHYTQVELLGLKENSLQGDSAIVEIMNSLGVKSTFTQDGVLLQKIEPKEHFEWDFTNCPDLAQTVAVIASAKRIPSIFTGIESLKIKETDRVLALQNELKKFGADLVETKANSEYKITFSELENFKIKGSIATYDDHRMAMAFAPLVMLGDIEIQEPQVVVKSYPSYWDDLKKIVAIKEI
jgi:3-phosphoshikimate 1-carboxyvinyltransferase